MVTMSQKLVSAPSAGLPASVDVAALGYASTLAVLSHFKQLMDSEGHTVDSRRMLADSSYAGDQLALGHTSPAQPLRACAMRVFALLHA